MDLGRADGRWTMRLVLAVPGDKGIRTPAELPPGVRVATEFPNIRDRLLRGPRHRGRGFVFARCDRGEDSRSLLTQSSI